MNSKFIVLEGLDGSGKTTIAKTLSNKKEYIYSKGVPSKTFMGKIVRKYPLTIFFLFDLFYLTYFHIKPYLRKNKIILQDRYDLSIKSYIPISKRWYNRLFFLIIKKFLIKPDLLIYFYLPINERIKRLQKSKGKYDNILVNNSNLIKIREKEYLKEYNRFKGSKIKIDTKKKNIKQTLKYVDNFMNNLKIQT